MSARRPSLYDCDVPILCADPKVNANEIQQVDLAAKIRFFKDGAHLGEPGVAVECIETHFAWVFLTQRYAYKLRKPILYRGLDTLSLDARGARCKEELRLNQALAPEVYLDVLPLTVAQDGGMTLGCAEQSIDITQKNANNRTVDWILQMRRLPSARMFDRMIHEDSWELSDLERVSAHLQAFYSRSSAVHISGPAYCRRLGAAVHRNCDEVTAAKSFGVDISSVVAIASAQQHWIDTHRPALIEQAERGALRDCHGDLKPEHVCCGPPVCVIDRLEFDADLRLLDPIEDLCFFWLECSQLGAPEAGEWLVRNYIRESGRSVPPSLMDFYFSQRAMARAKLAAWRLAESGADVARWRARIQKYLALAASAVRQAAEGRRCESALVRLEQRRQ